MGFSICSRLFLRDLLHLASILIAPHKVERRSPDRRSTFVKDF